MKCHEHILLLLNRTIMIFKFKFIICLYFANINHYYLKKYQFVKKYLSEQLCFKPLCLLSNKKNYDTNTTKSKIYKIYSSS